jgi:small subunit ribosomal protein S6
VSTSIDQQYEIAILYDPDLEIDLEKATSRVEKIFTDNGATITKTDNWGKRKLAYTIAKHDMAVYVFYIVEMPGANVQKLESVLNITDEVIRLLITKPDLKAIAKAEAAKSLKLEQAAKRGDHEDSEEDEE